MRLKTAHFVKAMIPAPANAVVLWCGYDAETKAPYAQTTACLGLILLSEHMVEDQGEYKVTKGKEILSGEFVPLTYSAGNQWYTAGKDDGDGWVITPQTALWELVLKLDQQSEPELLPVVLEALRRVGIVPQ